MSAATQLPEDADTLSDTPSPGPSTDNEKNWNDIDRIAFMYLLWETGKDDGIQKV